jgi:type II secretory pathway component PulF
VQAAITAYAIGKFIHVLAVVVAFGPVFVYPVFAAVARRTAPRGLPAVLRGLLLSDRFLVTPGMVVVLAAGIYLLSEGHIHSNEAWVTEGFVAIVALFALMHAFVVPRGRRALDLADRDLAAGDRLSPELESVSRQIAAGTGVAGLIVAITVFFMVVKP